jgi:hypothetical protein
MSDDLSAALWGALLGAVSGGLVSWASERHSDARRRKRAIKDSFEDVVCDLGGLVQTYWSRSGSDAAMESAIVSAIAKLRAKLAQLGLAIGENAEVRLAFKEMFQYSTGGPFATASRSADPSRARRCDISIQRLLTIVEAV